MMSTSADLDNIEFRIIKEDWNEYELKDGTKIRGRAFLTRIAENKNPKPRPDAKPGESINEYQMSIQKNFQVFASEINKGKPSKLIPPPKEIPKESIQEMEPLTNSEPWNTYEVIKNGTIIKIKLVVHKISKVKDVYDGFGEPYHIVNNAPVFSIEPQKDKRKFG